MHNRRYAATIHRQTDNPNALGKKNETTLKNAGVLRQIRHSYQGLSLDTQENAFKNIQSDVFLLSIRLCFNTFSSLFSFCERIVILKDFWHRCYPFDSSYPNYVNEKNVTSNILWQIHRML